MTALRPSPDGDPPDGGYTDRRIVPRRLVALPDGRTIAYAETGSGPDLVAIHGTLMTLEDMWLGPIPALARHFRVVAVDRPGHGHSVRLRGTDASPWRQAELIHAAVQSLGLRRPVVLGHSYGGAVALAYGLRFPEAVTGIVAIAPVCYPELRLEQMLFGPRATPVSGPVLSGALGRSADPMLLPLLWNAMFLPQTMPETFAAAFPFGFAGRPSQIVSEAEDALSLWAALSRSAATYPSCRVPVHILAGDADIVVNPAMHGAPAAAVTPGARFERLAGFGHMLHHFRADAVVQAARSVSRRS